MTVMARYVLVQADGTVSTGETDDSLPVHERLAAIQSLVGGYIEAVPLTEDAVGYVNEDGKIQGLDPNHAATHLFQACRPGWVDLFAGDLVVFGTGGGEDETDVPDSIVSLIHTITGRQAAP